MANATQEKFGYPETLIKEYAHWTVQLRPAQVTLGSLVLICKEDAKAFSDLSPQAFAEMGRVVAEIENALTSFNTYNRINYLMLMMVDPDVHFHVLPRYENQQTFSNTIYPDTGWPGPPDLKSAISPEGSERENLIVAIKSAFNTGSA